MIHVVQLKHSFSFDANGISHQEVKIRSGVIGPSLTILSSSATHLVHLVKDESHNQSVNVAPFQTFFLIALLQQGDFNCGASSQADFILNYLLSNFLSYFPKFPLKFSVSSQPGWLAGTIKATLHCRMEKFFLLM